MADNIVRIEMSGIESEKQALVVVFKRQLDAFHGIKKELEKVQWADSNYDALIDSMNDIGRTLSSTLQTLTNGYDIYVISNLVLLANEYLKFENKFPG